MWPDPDDHEEAELEQGVVDDQAALPERSECSDGHPVEVEDERPPAAVVDLR